MKLKAEGVRAGVPDYFLAVPTSYINENGGIVWSHGLWIELKHKDGNVSQSQKDMMEILRSHAYLTMVCFGWQQAKKAIEDYLA
jgi:hypothetical protein